MSIEISFDSCVLASYRVCYRSFRGKGRAAERGTRPLSNAAKSAPKKGRFVTLLSINAPRSRPDTSAYLIQSRFFLPASLGLAPAKKAGGEPNQPR